MRARVICVVTIFFAMAVATAVGNPLPNEIPGPFVPGAGGEVAFRSIDSAYASYAIVNSDTFYTDSVFDASLSPYDDYRWIIKFNTGIAFPETNSTIDIYAVYPAWGSTYHHAVNYGVSFEPPIDFFGFTLHPYGFSGDYNLPIPPDDHYWRIVGVTDWEYYGYEHMHRAQINPFPVNYDLVSWGRGFIFDQFIRINEVKPFGTNKFIEVAQHGDTAVCLDGWSLWANGLHIFTEADTLVDYLALYESHWDSGFSLTDTCQLVLFSSDGTVMNAMTWRPWPDTSMSASIRPEPPEYWTITKNLTIPTPGAPNLMSIAEKNSPLPSTVSILTAQPNPFNASATIGYEFTPGVSSATMDIFDINGRLIRSNDLTDTRPGYHETKISALPSSGTYLVRIETNRGSDEMKITYLK